MFWMSKTFASCSFVCAGVFGTCYTINETKTDDSVWFRKQKPQLLERNLQSRTNELQLFALNQNVFEDKSKENSTTVAQQLGINVFSTYKYYCCWSGNHFSLQMLRCFLFYFRFDLMWNGKFRTFLLCG